MSGHSSDEIEIQDPRCVLMVDEIGHVAVRLFKRSDHYEIGSMAYMGRKLDETESRLLVKLWNSIATHLQHNPISLKQLNQED